MNDDAVDATRLKEQAEQIEEEDDKEDDEEDDEEEGEKEEEEDTLTYTSVWKAMREVLERARPWQLEMVKLEAITSYERCRALDECPFELQHQHDF
ncbi:MAG: hypothetical protein M1840_006751 [Geoglossum simile]|nr:MAG: hypothetical protein M1840_006751 [Geoglossum simile]